MVKPHPPYLFKILIRLFGSECEASVSHNLQVLILLLQIFGYALLTVLTELEFLIGQTVLLKELAQTAFSDVLNHVLVKVGSLLSSYGLLYFETLVSLFAGDPSLADVRLDMLFAVEVVGV